MEKLKTFGWLAAAVAFVFLAISNFCDGYSWTFTEDGNHVMSGGYAWMTFQILAGVSLIVAGGALFWSERVKSAIAIALASLFGLFLDEIGKDFCLAVVYVVSVIYFWPTKFRLKTLALAVVLIVLHIYSYTSGSARETSAWIKLPLQLTLAVFFASRNAQVAAMIMKIKGKSIVAKDIAIKYFLEYGGKIWKPISQVLSSIFGKIPKPRLDSDYKVCSFYGYSVFVVGVICFAVLLFWASPGRIDMGVYGKTAQLPWDQDLIVSAIAQLIGCAIWGCFIFSQISCARKLRSYSIVSGSAPFHLLIARFLCVLFAVCVAVGVLYLFIEDPSEKNMTTDWTLHLTLANIQLLVSAARHCEPKTAIILSSLVTIWHLLGASFVVALVRENIAKIQSMESTPDNKMDVA